MATVCPFNDSSETSFFTGDNIVHKSLTPILLFVSLQCKLGHCQHARITKDTGYRKNICVDDLEHILTVSLCQNNDVIARSMIVEISLLISN